MILLDTSFVVSYYNEDDENHTMAISLMKEITDKLYGIVYLTDYVFDEVITVSFVRLKSLIKTMEIGNILKTSIEIIRVDKLIFELAWNIFQNQKNTELSFTDCTSLAIMMKTGIRSIATFDEDFKKIKGINVISGH